LSRYAAREGRPVMGVMIRPIMGDLARGSMHRLWSRRGFGALSVADVGRL